MRTTGYQIASWRKDRGACMCALTSVMKRRLWIGLRLGQYLGFLSWTEDERVDANGTECEEREAMRGCVTVCVFGQGTGEIRYIVQINDVICVLCLD